MYYHEEIQDLFKVEQGYVLAHCISADFALGAGIAKEFDKRYNMRERLISDYTEGYVGSVYLKDNVYNLVTKENGYDKPTYENLIEALKEMRDKMINNVQTKLAIPQIGCGLDKLDWEIVSALITSIFNDTDIEIMVCIKPDEGEQDSECENCGCHDCENNCDCCDYQEETEKIQDSQNEGWDNYLREKEIEKAEKELNDKIEEYELKNQINEIIKTLKEQLERLL